MGAIGVNRPDITEEKFRYAVCDLKMCRAELCDYFSCTKCLIYLRLKKYNLSIPRSLPKPRFTKKEIQDCFDEGLGYSRAAKRLGISESGLWHWVKKYNLSSPYNDWSISTHLCERCHKYNCWTIMTGKKICRSCVTTLRRQFLKHKLIQVLGGKCSQCGYDKSTSALDFHHIRDKTTAITNFITPINAKKPNINKIKELDNDLQNCVVLCANCHREHHNGSTEYLNEDYESWFEDEILPYLTSHF